MVAQNGRHAIPNPKRKPNNERWSPETATTPMPKSIGYGILARIRSHSIFTLYYTSRTLSPPYQIRAEPERAQRLSHSVRPQTPPVSPFTHAPLAAIAGWEMRPGSRPSPALAGAASCPPPDAAAGRAPSVPLAVPLAPPRVQGRFCWSRWSRWPCAQRGRVLS